MDCDIGRAGDGAAIGVDIDKLVGSRLIVQGASGAGKTYLIRKLLEVSHGAVQHLVLDVEDEFYTLRERYEYVIAGGEHADCPATPENAHELARTLLRLGTSAIIQLNDLGLARQRRFVAAFLGAMISAPRALWHPTLVVLDETHRYAPQSQSAESLAAVTALATQGRKRGFSAVFATQRMSMVSKDVLGQCPNRMIGRVDQALDRRVGADTLGMAPSSADARGLQDLRPGQFWTVGPAFTPKPVLTKIDKVETTHLRPGQRHVPTPPPPAQLKAILAELATIAETPEADTTAAPATVVDDAAIVSARNDGLKKGYDIAADQYRGMLREVGDEMCALAERLLAASGTAETAGPAPLPAEPVAPKPKANGSGERQTGERPSAAAKLIGILQGIYPAKLTWVQLCTLAGIKARGGHFNAARKAMRESGEIEESGDQRLVRARSNGIDAGPRIPLDLASAVKMWTLVLRGPAGGMLNVIHEYHPNGLTRDHLSDILQIKPYGGHWNGGLSQLRNNDLIAEIDGRLVLDEDGLRGRHDERTAA